MRFRSGNSAAALLILAAAGGVALLLNARSAPSAPLAGRPNAPAADPPAASSVPQPAEPPPPAAVQCGVVSGTPPASPPPPSLEEAMQLVESPDPEDRRRAFDGIRALVRRLDEAPPEEAARVRDFVLSLLRSPEIEVRRSALRYLEELGEAALPTAAALVAEAALPPSDVLDVVSFLLSSDRCFEFLSLDDPTAREYVLRSIERQGASPSSRAIEILLTTRRDVLLDAEPRQLECWFAEAACDRNRLPQVRAFLREADLKDSQRLAVLKGIDWNSHDDAEFAELVREALPRIGSAHARLEAMHPCLAFDDEDLVASLLRERLAVEANEWLRLRLREWLDGVTGD